MDTPEETNNRQLVAGFGSVRPAGSAENRDETGSKVVPVPGEPEVEALNGSLIIQNQAAEHSRKAEEAMETFRYETAVLCLYKAVTLQPEQAQLHAGRAEAFLQLCDFQSAAGCYRRARFLRPGAFSARLAFIYGLQGQCLFDRGLFTDALQAFSQAAEMKPGCKIYELRSLACLAALGRHDDCLKLLTDQITRGPTADLLVFRARLHRQLNQMSRCLGDVKSALALSPANQEAGALLRQLQEASEEARRQAVNRTLCGRLPEALCLLNVALELRPQHGRLYLFRGILFRRLKEFTAAIEDLVQAVELSEEEDGRGIEHDSVAEDEDGRGIEHDSVAEEADGRGIEHDSIAEYEDGRGIEHDSIAEEAQLQLVLTYNDFAVQCFTGGLYAEATLLLNKAIEEEKGLAGLYLNRGDCFFKQGDWLYALADYQQAEEMMRPDDPALRLRLAVIHNRLASSCFRDGRFQEAADMFSLAVRYNPTNPQYYENRSKTLRKLLDMRGAREDLIRLLVLDPSNEEAVPGGGRHVFSGRPIQPDGPQYYENRSKTLRKLLDMRGAREDLIRLLVLDPSNEEVPAMLMSMFPGCSVSDVLSSPKGRAVRVQLTDTVRNLTSPSDPQRVRRLRRTTAGETSPPEDVTAAGKQVQDLQTAVKGLLQVNDSDHDRPAPQRLQPPSRDPGGSE